MNKRELPKAKHGSVTNDSGDVGSTIIRRLRDLQDNIDQDLALLKQYEDVLRYEEDPRRRSKYVREIELLHRSAAEYRREYIELRYGVRDETVVESDELTTRLTHVDEKLTTLLNGETEILEQIVGLKQMLASHYKGEDQILVREISEELSNSELRTVQLVLSAVESDEIKEAELVSLLESARQALLRIDEQNSTIARHQDVSKVISSPTADLKHKLKLTLPLIPLLLNYETELTFGSGINLESLWNRIVRKVRGNK